MRPPGQGLLCLLVACLLLLYTGTLDFLRDGLRQVNLDRSEIRLVERRGIVLLLLLLHIAQDAPVTF